MLATTLIAAAALGQQDAVELFRQFKAGEKLTYQVRSHLISEQQQYGQPFFLPSEIDINYDFTMDVKEIKADGFAVMEYRRPTMTQIDGETADAAPKTHVEKVNWVMQLTVSPINEITALKDLNAKPEPKKTGGLRASTFAEIARASTAQLSIGAFIQELQRLSLFIGGLDSAMDFSPKLPYEEVKPGATWKKTVGYSPQVLKGKGDRQAMQRLDYTYTYDGLHTMDGQKVHQITALLDLDADAGKFINQALGATPGQTGLRAIKLKLKAKIVYYLDEKTKHTLRADAESKGGWTIEITDLPNDPYVEERLTGKTSLRLVKRS